MGLLLSGRTTYRLHERVGRGGMATVHLGTMVGPAGERRVAIKQLAAEDALDETARSRLVDEARLVFQLTHANICQVFDLASSHDGTFVVMEFVEGLDLHALVTRAGPLELPHALYIAREIAHALDYAHRRSDEQGRPLLLVHGDVKPGNVLLSCEGEVKLADFGIARALGRTPDRPQVVAGTRGFLAPELKTHATSQRADLYALGITLYVVLTGMRPGSASFAPHALRRARPDASVELERLVARATASEPGARFGSAAQLEKALALELARQFAEFTPSSLARVVRMHQLRSTATPAPASDAVLESMTSVTVDALPRRTPPEVAAATVTLPRSTETSPTGPTRRWRWLAVFVLALAATASYLAWPGEPAAIRAGLPIAIDAAAQAVAVAPPVDAAPQVPTIAVDAAAQVPAATTVAEAPRSPAPHRGSHREVTPPHRSPPHRAAVAPTAEPGFLTVTARSWGAVYVDGKQVAAQTPLYRHPVAAGVHRIKVFQPSSGEYSSVQQVDVRPGEVAELSFK